MDNKGHPSGLRTISEEHASDSNKRSDGFSLPLMSGSDNNKAEKHLSRSISYERFLSENNERVVLNVGGKRFETYL